MDQLLLITDNPGRTGQLARALRDTWNSCVHDLRGADIQLGNPVAVVSDVADLTPANVSRLRQRLNGVPHPIPRLVILHDSGTHARIKAIALGATAMLGATAGPDAIRVTLGKLEADDVGPVPRARSLAGTARRFISEVFVPGGPLAPAVIESGTDLIAQAVEETGVRDWVQAVRRFDDATHQHCLLVAGLAAGFASQLGFSELDRHRLTKAALLHDVGKIHIPPAILNKTGKLTDAEMALVRQHPEQGHAMLLGQGFEEEILVVVRSHHEMLDGSGYPDGLADHDIPDLVQLVTICDIYAALIERRPYKPPMPREEAFDILAGMAGRLDPLLVEAFRPVAAFTPSPSHRPTIRIIDP